MNKEDKIKLSILTFGLVFLFVILLFIFCMFSSTGYGALMGLIVSFLVVMVILIFTYPIIFKDYIEEYWKKVEEKNVKKEEQET